MSDCVAVSLRVLKEHEEAVRVLATAEGYSQERYSKGLDTITFFFEQVNYGNLMCLSELQEMGIAYDSAWDMGDSYGPGTHYCRFTEEGECVITQVFDSELSVELDTLLANLDDYAALRKIIADRASKVLVEPLDSKQIEYGKLYQTRRLISTD